MKRGASLAVLAVVLIAGGVWLLLSDDEMTPGADAPTTASPSSPSATARPADDNTATRETDEELARQLELRRSRSGIADGGTLDGAVAEFSFDAGMLDDLARGQILAWLRDNAEVAAKRVDDYCKATKGLVDPRDAKPPSRERDAALFMAGRSDWEDGRFGLLHLTPALTERMNNPPGAWRKMGPELYAGLDFSWMKALLQFETWSLATASPLRDVAEMTNFFEAPIPNYVTLQHWAKLRLLKGLHENDLANASLEVRHLAELIGTNGILVGDMIRIALFGIERAFYEEHGIATPPAMTQNDAMRRRHAAFAAMDFLLPGVDGATREKAMKCIPNRCSALMEGMGAAASLRGIAPGAADQLQWLRGQEQCDSELADLAMKSKPMDPKRLFDSVGDRSLEKSMNALMATLDGGN
ncbi:MAG: hypothetical protein JNM17_34480 [Archangium sp.]|nr:hypothetical protein [Archangium sp.]